MVFDFNKDTGELLLHDISEKGTAQLYDMGDPPCPQIWKAHRQCVVPLGRDLYSAIDPSPTREWILEIHRARFLLKSPQTRAGEEASLAPQKLAFAHQPDPERTAEGTLQRLVTLGLQSLCEPTVRLNPYNARFQTQLEPEAEEQMRYTKLRPLGGGGQDDVHQVVDMYAGTHHACRVIAVKAAAPDLNIHSERAFRAKVEMEVRLVQKLEHHHIMPYVQCQGFRGPQIEIFMPIYDGRAAGGPGHGGRHVFQIGGALDFVHSHRPRFLLTDFGIAKVVDASRTAIGTRGYAAPEVIYQSAEQTPKVDIYSLGATLVNCLVEVKVTNATIWQEWHQPLQQSLKEHAPELEPMLADDPSSRPTAGWLLSQLTPWKNRATRCRKY
ncbi:kinase-like domain-containing protein [Staphylotrichum tortipilum]|uniref:Kinase-like domain-containing protein n=1 Tax=Staphylotrichum tortipilum TaxID=2831512 RepID=A0AAN6RSQ3_9PEZI|nr:kinase-like domain-containing protein [Staphylotrichum longicolle]